MQKLRIKTKRDWLIAFVFAFLLTYVIVLRFRGEINEFLLPLTPDRISFFNQPENQGVYAVTVLVMSVLTIGVMIYKKIRGKYIALALAAGIVIAGAAIGSYYYECHLMLKVPSEYQPEDVSVFCLGGPEASHGSYKLDEETKAQLVDKVLTLEPLSKEEEKRQRDRSNMEDNGEETSVSISYPKQHGQSYHIWVGVRDGVIRIHKGHSPNSDPIYKDNGLLGLIEQLKTSEELQNNQ